MKIMIADPPPGYSYPWTKGDAVLLQEIDNMPGHVAVTTKDGKVHWGFDADGFREPSEDEL